MKTNLLPQSVRVLSFLLVGGLAASAQITIFEESMGTVGGTTAISTHEANDGFDNDAFTMTDGGAANPADVRITSASSGYTNAAGTAASGGANLWFTSTSGDRGFAIQGIDSSSYTNLALTFAMRKEGTTTLPTFAVEWSTNSGAAWTAIALTGLPDAADPTGWYLVGELALPEGAQSSDLWLRWVKSGSVAMRIDDVLLRGENPSAPVLDIATPDQTVPFETSSITVTGTANAQVVGDLTWTNDLTGGAGTAAADSDWTIAGIALDVGANLITVVGTNAGGLSAQDAVTITREAAPVTNVSFTAESDDVAEDAGTYVVTVIKTVPTGDVSGEIALGGTAVEGAGNDYTIDTTNFTMNGSTTSATFTITLNDDSEQETSETIVLDLVNVTGGDPAAPATFTLTILANDAPPPAGGIVWINEFLYNPPGTDSNEYIEVAGPAGVDLDGYQLIWYNGSDGGVLGSNVLTGILDDEGCGLGALSFEAILQNGPDGIALVSNGTTVLEFISYGGSFTATEGPAVGLTSTDVGVTANNTTNTVQLGGTGDTGPDFAWEVAAPSPGDLNINQAIDPCGGTGPADFDIAAVSMTNNQIAVVVPTETGFVYNLDVTTNLLDPGGWAEALDTENGTGGDVTLIDPAPGVPFRIYRVRAEE